MDSKLLAFRLARPVEPGADLVGFGYDPQSQTAAWGGNGTANASYHCTNKTAHSNGAKCNAYGNYCNTWNGRGTWWCDT
jgi:hypothetical protein